MRSKSDFQSDLQGLITDKSKSYTSNESQKDNKITFKTGEYQYKGTKTSLTTHHENKGKQAYIYYSKKGDTLKEFQDISQYYHPTIQTYYKQSKGNKKYNEPIFNYFNAAKQQILANKSGSDDCFSQEQRLYYEQVEKANAEQSLKIKELEQQLKNIQHKITIQGSKTHPNPTYPLNPGSIGHKYSQNSTEKGLNQKSFLLQRKIQSLEQENRSYYKQIQDMDHQMQKLQEKIDKQQGVHQQVIEGNHKIKREWELIIQQRDKIAQCYQEIELTQEKLRKAEIQNEKKIEDKQKEIKQEYSKLMKQVSEVSMSNQEQIRQLQRQKQKAAQEIERKDRQLNQREKQIENGQKQLQRSRQDFKEETIKMSNAIKKNNIESNKLMERLKNQERSEEEAQKIKIEKYLSKIQELESAELRIEASLKKLTFDNQHLENKNQQLNLKIQELTQEEKSLIDAILQLQNDLGHLVRCIKQNEELLQQIRNKKEQEIEKQMMERFKQMDRLQREKAEMKELMKIEHQNKNQLLNELAQLQNNKQSKKREIKGLQKQIKLLKQEKNRQKEALNQFVQQFNQQTENLRKSQQTTLRNQQNHFTHSIASLQSQQVALLDHIKHLRRQIDQLQIKKQSSKTKIKDQIEQLEDKKNQYSLQYEQYLSKITAASHQKNVLVEEMGDIIRQKQELIKEIEILCNKRAEQANTKPLDTQYIKEKSTEHILILKQQLKAANENTVKQKQKFHLIHQKQIKQLKDYHNKQLHSIKLEQETLKRDQAAKILELQQQLSASLAVYQQIEELRHQLSAVKQQNLQHLVTIENIQRQSQDKIKKQVDEQLFKREISLRDQMATKISEIQQTHQITVTNMKNKKAQLELTIVQLKNSIDSHNIQVMKTQTTINNLQQQLSKYAQLYYQLHQKLKQRQELREFVSSYFDSSREKIFYFVNKLFSQNEKQYQLMVGYRELLRQNHIKYSGIDDQKEENHNKILTEELKQRIEEAIQMKLKLNKEYFDQKMLEMLKRVEELEKRKL